MSNLDKLVKMFKDRENQTQIGITQGEVIGVSPLRIQYGDRVILEQRHLVVADSLVSGYTGEYTDNDTISDVGLVVTTKTVTTTNPLQVGNKVIMIPDNSMKKWYVIDKVGVI